MDAASSGENPCRQLSASFSEVTALSAMSAATIWHRSRAMDGVANSLSSSSSNASGCLALGTRTVTSLSRKPDSGSIKMVHRRLKIECATAIPIREADSFKNAG